MTKGEERLSDRNEGGEVGEEEEGTTPRQPHKRRNGPLDNDDGEREGKTPVDDIGVGGKKHPTRSGKEAPDDNEEGKKESFNHDEEEKTTR